MTGEGTWRERRHARRGGRGRHFWPTGIASRVALILMICLFVVQAASILLYIRDRANAANEVFANSVADRIGAIVELMERTPPKRRARIIRAVNSPTLWVTWVPNKPMPMAMGPGWHHSAHASREVIRHMGPLGDRPVEVRVLGNWDAPPIQSSTVTGQPVPDLLPSRRKIAISVGQRDGSWLVFTVASDTTSLRWGIHMAFWIALAGGFILLFAVWAGHRVTRPLARFAEAADRLGVDVRAPPLPEGGSRELRGATRAFNRMQERLRRLVDDRTLMLAAISHDLRTALTRLKLRAEFIADREQQEKANADLDEMRAMLESTLAFARDDTAEEPRTRVDLAALLASLCDDLADTGYKASYEGPERFTYECRPVALRRAFTNLIVNAASYGEAATVGLAEAEGDVEVTVADRGPGIPEAMREKVFTPFFRLEGSRSRETGGTGLGMAVARAIIRRHGGDIALEDRPGGGLVARVRLPGTP